jgi:hypothetical protein
MLQVAIMAVAGAALMSCLSPALTTAALEEWEHCADKARRVTARDPIRR